MGITYSKKMLLNYISDVKDFVSIASKYSEDIDVGSSSHIIDAKSIIGLMCLDLSKPVTVTINTEDINRASQFFTELSKLIVEE